MKNINFLRISLFLIFFVTISSNNFAETMFKDNFQEPNQWNYVADTVMGGISTGGVEFKNIEGKTIAILTGNVTTENNGGFVRLSNRVDIKSNDFKGIKFQAKGNNEAYEIHVTLKGIKMPPWSYLSKAFEVTDYWQEYRIEFKDLKSNGFAVASMKPKNIRDISIAGYGRDFEVDLAIKDISLFTE